MFRRLPALRFFRQIHPKVFPPAAESPSMDHEINPPADSNDPTFLRARALSLSVGAIRKAQGKKCPGDFPVGTIEWHAVVEEFANDVLKAMLSEPDLPILEFKRGNTGK
ncbi:MULTISPECIES: hypothetical protein [unclassified Caballeronia]|uniref:hypothetical protein n=1 Tax=unclassified Caballeronia TaxID=2646786 RepID=UPI001F152758|nr:MULTISPECIES: hypothetical protein [unclassified Caballeronia]